jgi:two-component system response regulator YesN
VNSVEPTAVVAARRFIEEHATAEDLTLGRTAKHVRLSEDYFSKLFQRSTGLTFTDYLCRVRIDRVRHLLATTPMGVAEVALACGFGSVPHFNRVFRRYTSLAPTAYRRTMHPFPQTSGLQKTLGCEG